MKRFISILTVVILVLISLSDYAQACFVSIRLFPEIVTETQDIFIGTLSHAEEIEVHESQGVVISVTYQFTFRVDEVIRGELSPGEAVDITLGITPDIALGSPCEDGRLAQAYEGSYLVLVVPNLTYQFYQFFKIEQDGTLINFFPDYEARIREELNSKPGGFLGIETNAAAGYQHGLEMKNSCPKTIDEARVAIRTALRAARLPAIRSALRTGAAVLLIVAVPALLLALHLIRRKRNK